MSVLGRIFDIFGNGGNNKFYARDFRNAYGFRPDINPPRQKFNGYINFIVNRELYGESWYNDNASFRTQISSLVRTASLPEIEFKTDTKNQYNRKRIINTGVEYQPVDIKVIDTINNEWLILFMKYYSYHYMNPRNKQGKDPSRETVGGTTTPGKETINSLFGQDTDAWNSNAYGFNLNLTSTFFERIDYVLYHGNKAVQYSLVNPTLTRFRTSDIDYASSEVMEFDMTFEYESFNVYQNVNFGLSEVDILRFEDGKNFTGPAFVPNGTPVVLDTERTLEFLGPVPRSGQPQSEPTPEIDPISGLPTITVNSGIKPDSIYGKKGSFAAPTEKDKSFLEGLLGSVADNALTAAIHGKSIKNAVVSTAVGGVVTGITNQITTPVRGPKPKGPGGGG